MYRYGKKNKDNNLRKKLLIIALISLIPFILIATIGYFDWSKITEFDYKVSSYFYELRTEKLNFIVITITHMGDLFTQTLITVLGVFVLILMKKWKTGLWYGLTVLLGAGALNLSVKELYKRIRPDQIKALVDIGGYSFPSGHAMGSFIVYGGILFIILRSLSPSKLKVFFSVLIFLAIMSIGLSRIYLAVHFPSDVLAGFSLGISWLLVSIITLGLKVTGEEFRDRNLHSIKML